MIRRAAGLLACVAACACAAGVVPAPPFATAAAAGLGPGVVNAGAQRAQGAGHVVRGTVGQLAIGSSHGSGRVLRHGFWAGGEVIVPVDVEKPGADAPAPPARLEFGVPFPNPTRGAVSFRLALPAAAEVALDVYDVAGRRVAGPPPRRLAPGSHDLRWAPGEPAAGAAGAGVYFARLRVDGRVEATRRFSRVR